MKASVAGQSGWTLVDAHRWTDLGTQLIGQQISTLDESAAEQRSTLPGWTRKHLIAHLCGNAEALGNLVRWAATGEPTPMYSSDRRRQADIEAGGELSVRELRLWFGRSSADLAAGMEDLTPHQWSTDVVTAQGRTVSATIIPWLRAREVLIHAVDLDTSLGFGDLPREFLAAVVTDILTKRNDRPADGTAPTFAIASASNDDAVALAIAHGENRTTVRGSLSDVAAYLAGRAPTGELHVALGQPLPVLPPWL